MKLMENGLLFANGKDKAITWMNSTVNGKPVVTRSGYIVEFNALWYNALCFYTELMGEYLSRVLIRLSSRWINRSRKPL